MDDGSGTCSSGVCTKCASGKVWNGENSDCVETSSGITLSVEDPKTDITILPDASYTVKAKAVFATKYDSKQVRYINISATGTCPTAWASYKTMTGGEDNVWSASWSSVGANVDQKICFWALGIDNDGPSTDYSDKVMSGKIMMSGTPATPPTSTITSPIDKKAYTAGTSIAAISGTSSGNTKSVEISIKEVSSGKYAVMSSGHWSFTSTAEIWLTGASLTNEKTVWNYGIDPATWMAGKSYEICSRATADSGVQSPKTCITFSITATQDTTPPTKTLDYIEISPSSASIAVGASQTFEVTAHYSDGTFTYKGSYESNPAGLRCTSNSAVAEHINNSACVFTAKSAGTATITASYTEGGVTRTKAATLLVFEPQPCVITSASFGLIDTNPNKKADPGESIRLTGTAYGGCHLATKFQIDAKGGNCDIQFTGGDMSGLTISVSGLQSSGTSSFTGEWIVPPKIHDDCFGKTVETESGSFNAGLWQGNPGTGREVSLGYATGSFTFVSHPCTGKTTGTQVSGVCDGINYCINNICCGDDSGEKYIDSSADASGAMGSDAKACCTDTNFCVDGTVTCRQAGSSSLYSGTGTYSTTRFVCVSTTSGAEWKKSCAGNTLSLIHI